MLTESNTDANVLRCSNINTKTSNVVTKQTISTSLVIACRGDNNAVVAPDFDFLQVTLPEGTFSSPQAEGFQIAVPSVPGMS